MRLTECRLKSIRAVRGHSTTVEFGFAQCLVWDQDEMNTKKQSLGKALVLAGAGLSFLFSVGLWFFGQREEGLFVGIWVPSILSFGSLMFAGQGVRS